MYIIFPIILIILIFFFFVNHFRKRHIICKIRNMCLCDKFALLNELAEPFGFRYQLSQDIFTTGIYALQRDFGYTHLYDLASMSMNMVFECEPVYFNYKGKTWLVELWKGQYGINIGAEAGIYHANRIIPPPLRPQTLFASASDDEMMPISLKLLKNGETLFCSSQVHWWLGIFLMGQYSEPEPLSLTAAISFPDEEMSSAFIRSLLALGYKTEEIRISNTTVEFTLTTPKSGCCVASRRCCRRHVQWKNRVFVRLFLWVTKPFCSTMDRLLYLYFFLPAIFRKTVRIRPFWKKKRRPV